MPSVAPETEEVPVPSVPISTSAVADEHLDVFKKPEPPAPAGDAGIISRRHKYVNFHLVGYQLVMDGLTNLIPV